MATGVLLGERRGAATLALTAAVVVLFYWWTASGGASFGVHEPQDGHYNLLTQAFLHGHLHLLVSPRPELFELADPLDPAKNAAYRLHDASLYHGRYYLYFGPTPAIVLFAPWALAGLGDLPEPLAAFLFSTGAFLFACFLMRHLVRRHRPETPRWLQALVIGALGFANVMPYILRGAGVYEVAISSGAFFLMASAWALVTAADRHPQGIARWMLGGLCLGLAVGSRPNHLLLVPLFLLLAWPVFRDARQRRRALIATAVPLALCLTLFGAYNRARFGSWTELGTRYCLVGHPPLPWFTPSVSFVPALYFDLLAPPAIKTEFPFLFAESRFPGALPQEFYAEATTGLLIHSPFLVLLLGWPWWRRRLAVEGGLRIARLAAIGATSLLVTALIVPWATMRYEVDYAGFLALAAFWLWLAVDAHLAGGARILSRALLVFLTVWVGFVIGALSLTGHDDTLRLRNPDLFARLAHRWAPLGAWLRPLEGRRQPPASLLDRIVTDDGRPRLHTHVRIALPETLSRDREPLLSSGTAEAHDVLWLRGAAGRWTFQLTPAQGPESASGALDISPNQFRSMNIELDRAQHRVRVDIDGRLVADLAGNLAPIRAATVVLGRGPRGRSALDLGHFSGTILLQTMLDAAPPGLDRLPPIAETPAVLSEREPPSVAPGQLWMAPAREGVRIFDGAAWLWIPRYFVDRARVVREIRFAPAAAGIVEPVLVSGEPAHDAVFVRHLGAGSLAFGLAQWRGAWELGTVGPAVVRSMGLQALQVTLDRPAGVAIVALDGREVLRARAELGPIARSEMRLGRSPEDRPLGTGVLTGALAEN